MGKPGGWGALLVTAVGLVPIAGSGCAPPAAHPHLTAVVVATGFQPDVEFAPYYVAQALGYYRAARLRVTMNYARDPNLLLDVGTGRYTFAVTGGDSAVVAAAAGARITYVMAQYQRYPIGAIALRRNGVPLTSPRQLKGLTVGISLPGSSTDFGLDALLRAGGLTPRDVTVVALGFTEVEALVSRRVQVAMTYIDNEPVQAAALGYPTYVLPVARYLQLTSTGVVTGRAELSSHRATVLRFVTASLRGLAYTLAHPGAAFRICLRHLPTVVGAREIAITRRVLSARLEFQQPPTAHPLGWSDPAGWHTTIRFLHQIGAISSVPTASRLFTNALVDQAGVSGDRPRPEAP